MLDRLAVVVQFRENAFPFPEEAKMFVAILVAMSLQAKGETAPVPWMTDFKEAAAQAQKLGRPLVIDAGREG
jgi:hypothetical protein